MRAPDIAEGEESFVPSVAGVHGAAQPVETQVCCLCHTRPTAMLCFVTSEIIREPDGAYSLRLYPVCISCVRSGALIEARSHIAARNAKSTVRAS